MKKNKLSVRQKIFYNMTSWIERKENNNPFDAKLLLVEILAFFMLLFILIIIPAMLIIYSGFGNNPISLLYMLYSTPAIIWLIIGVFDKHNLKFWKWW